MASGGARALTPLGRLIVFPKALYKGQHVALEMLRLKIPCCWLVSRVYRRIVDGACRL